MGYQPVQRGLGVHEEAGDFDKFRLAERPRAEDSQHLENHIAVEVYLRRAADADVAGAGEGAQAG